MLTADIIEFNETTYMVIDEQITIDRQGMALLASYQQGLGAERILFLNEDKILFVADNTGNEKQVLPADLLIVKSLSGQTRDREMRYKKAYFTEYFTNKVIVASHVGMAC